MYMYHNSLDGEDYYSVDECGNAHMASVRLRPNSNHPLRKQFNKVYVRSHSMVNLRMMPLTT